MHCLIQFLTMPCKAGIALITLKEESSNLPNSIQPVNEGAKTGPVICLQKLLLTSKLHCLSPKQSVDEYTAGSIMKSKSNQNSFDNNLK